MECIKPTYFCLSLHVFNSYETPVALLSTFGELDHFQNKLDCVN